MKLVAMPPQLLHGLGGFHEGQIIGTFEVLNKKLGSFGKEDEEIPPEAASACMEYPWPGNVRELENEMKRLVLSVFGPTVEKADLSEAIGRSHVEAVPSISTPRLLKDIVSELETRMIQEALQRTKQNQQHAAKALGLSRHGLIKKMKRYNIRIRDS
jgi:DNA-binding NtrC family response regulator